MHDNNPELLWDQLLSRHADLVRKAFTTLPAEEKHAVQVHLMNMAQEPGWHAEQRLSAQAALIVIQEIELE